MSFIIENDVSVRGTLRLRLDSKKGIGLEDLKEAQLRLAVIKWTAPALTAHGAGKGLLSFHWLGIASF